MIRGLCASLAALACAAPALGAEGGPIRGGEHEGFTRIVMLVEPMTEWSLETGDASATLFFPGKSLGFSTSEVFARIPRTRIRDVSTRRDPSGTTVSVELGCDCRISTAFVSAQYLALDISDRTAQPTPIIAEPDQETSDERDRREASIVSSAEDVLIQQIERAANQGLVRLSNETAAGLPADLGALTNIAPPAPPAAPRPLGETAPPASDEASGATENPTKLLDHEQISALTVFDRDGGRIADRLSQPAQQPECLPDSRLNVAEWSDGSSFTDQLGELRRQLIGEFDAIDKQAILDLSRLYIHFGMGTEAEALLQSFGYQGAHRALLTDMSRVVEGRPASPYGPLSRNGACPGAHGLWLAASGAAPAFHSAEHFLTVHAAFAALPRHLRALVGPTLIARLIDDERIREARLILDTAARPGHPLSAEMQLAEARVVAAEGSPEAAIDALNALADTAPHNGFEVLESLVTLSLETGTAIPDHTLTDLRAVLTLSRNTAREPALRLMLARSLAARGDLPGAIAEIRAARTRLPATAELETTAVAILSDADPARTGPAAYAETVIAAQDLIPERPEFDVARQRIAAHLLALGLPQQSADIAAPAAARTDAGRLQLAEANLRLGRSDAVRLGLRGMRSPRAVSLQARAFALEGDYVQAQATLESAGLPRAAGDYSWLSGDWAGARSAAQGDKIRAAMAEFMSARSGATPARSPAVAPEILDPPSAFVEPLPRLDRPTLAAARRLLATGGQLENLMGQLLEPPAAPPE